MLTTKIIGNKIAEARKSAKLSQAQLAEALFISSQAVGKWERGESMPDIITFNRLAEILDVDLNYFSENFLPAVTERGPEEPKERQTNEFPAKKQKLIWDMSCGNWVEADFSGLKNLNEKFSYSNLRRCLFIGSDLSGLQLKSNNVDSCDFSGSEFSGSHIQSSNLVNNQFKECSLKETEFSVSHIKGCDFSGADLSGASLKFGAFLKNTITNAVLNRTSFKAMQFADIVFEGTMEECAFENCAFTRVTFLNSTLINTFFKNKSMKRISFIGCQADRMTYEFLKNGKADLAGLTLV